jgi:hypothetical protein
MTTKTVEELAVELGQIMAFGQVIDLLLNETSAVSNSTSARLDVQREYAEQQAVLEVLRFLRNDVQELMNKVGK